MKLAIALSGGGMSCAYSVGALLALAEQYHLATPALILGSSGSTGTLAYYVAGQYAAVRNIWENLLSNRRFVSYLRPWRVMDIDYLVDEVFKKQEPLDVAAVRNSPTLALISATDPESGATTYFSNKTDVDFFEVLRASSAIPVAYRKKVEIQGKDYIDGDLSSPLWRNIQKAREEGADIVLAIHTSNVSFLGNLFIRLYSYVVPQKLGAVIRNSYFGENSNNLQGADLVLRPSRPLPTGTLDNTRSHLKEALQMGYEDVLKHKTLPELLRKITAS